MRSEAVVTYAVQPSKTDEPSSEISAESCMPLTNCFPLGGLIPFCCRACARGSASSVVSCPPCAAPPSSTGPQHAPIGPSSPRCWRSFFCFFFLSPPWFIFPLYYEWLSPLAQRADLFCVKHGGECPLWPPVFISSISEDPKFPCISKPPSCNVYQTFIVSKCVLLGPGAPFLGDARRADFFLSL